MCGCVCECCTLVQTMTRGCRRHRYALHCHTNVRRSHTLRSTRVRACAAPHTQQLTCRCQLAGGALGTSSSGWRDHLGRGAHGGRGGSLGSHRGVCAAYVALVLLVSPRSHTLQLHRGCVPQAVSGAATGLAAWYCLARTSRRVAEWRPRGRSAGTENRRSAGAGTQLQALDSAAGGTCAWFVRTRVCWWWHWCWREDNRRWRLFESRSAR